MTLSKNKIINMVNKIYFMKKIRAILLWCIFMHGSYLPLQSADHDASQDTTTDLIRYIKHRDQYFPWLEREYKKLWSWEIAGKSDMTKIFNNATDKDLQYLYEYRRQIKNFEQDTHEEIVQLLQEGQSLDAVDGSGKRAMDYVTHLPIYHALQNVGAKEEPRFLWHERMLFLDSHKLHIASGLIAATLAAGVWYSCSSPKQQKIEENNPQNVQDEFGRTELMNYLHVQEENVYQLSQKVSFIKQCYGLTYDSRGNLIDGSITITGQSYGEIERRKIEYARIFREQAPHWKSYQDELNKTKLMIQSMLDAKINLHLKDIDGKTVLNYCKMPESYTLLRNAGAPFDYKSYCYFNPGTSFVVIASCVGIAMGAFSWYESYVRENGILTERCTKGDEFDRFYESKFNAE